MKRFELRSASIRQNAIGYLQQLPIDEKHPMVVTVQEQTRSLAQNRRLWAGLNDVSKQIDWHGRHLSSEEWKWVFGAALKKQEVVPGIDGGFVVLGQSTSRMTIAEMRDLIELINAFGAEHEVKWSEDYIQAAEWSARFGDKKAAA